MKAVTILISLVLLSAAAFSQSKDETSIHKVLDDQVTAWNRGDVEGFMSIGYWKSEKLKFVSGDKITYGWQQTLDNYKKNYDSKEKMGFLSFDGLETEILSKDAAFVTGSWHLKREKDSLGGKFTLLLRKFKEGWRIVVDHSS